MGDVTVRGTEADRSGKAGGGGGTEGVDPFVEVETWAAASPRRRRRSSSVGELFPVGGDRPLPVEELAGEGKGSGNGNGADERRFRLESMPVPLTEAAFIAAKEEKAAAAAAEVGKNWENVGNAG